MSLITIIVPVYNSEKYLKEALDSIINQTYKNLQIILIDDGSTDSSGVICDDYSQKDNRVIVIHQENCGRGGVRNTGIEKASGEYCLFVDSDDTLTSDHVAFLYHLLGKYNTEVAMCAFERKNTPYRNELSEQCMIGNKKIFEYFLKARRYAVYSRIAKTSLIKQLRFSKYARAQDAFFSAQLFTKVESIAISPDVKYFYRHNETSISHGPFKLEILDELLVGKEILDLTHEKYPEFDSIAEKNYKEMLDGLLNRIIRQTGFFKHYQERKIALNKLLFIVNNDFKKLSILGIKYFSARSLPAFLLPLDFRIKCFFSKILYFWTK